MCVFDVVLSRIVLAAVAVTDTQQSVLSSAREEMAARRRLARQDSRLSVKSLIETIENAAKQAGRASQSSTGSGASSETGETPPPGNETPTPAPATPVTPDSDDALRDSILQSAKGIEFARRTSCSDLSMYMLLALRFLPCLLTYFYLIYV